MALTSWNLTSRGTLWLIAAALIAGLTATATPGHTAPTFRRVAGKIHYYNPTEVRVSANGRYVVIAAWLTPLPGETSDAYDDNDNYPNNFPLQILRFDLKTGAETLVSHNAAGKPGNDNSMSPSISDDGRFVAFASDATDLNGVDSNAARDVFLWDAKGGQVQRLSVDRLGHEVIVYKTSTLQVAGDLPTISGDGRTVAFISDGDITHDPRYRNPQTTRYTGLFIRTLSNGRVSALTDIHGAVVRTALTGIGPDGDGTRELEWNNGAQSAISRPALSQNGQIIAFAMNNSDCFNANHADFGIKKAAEQNVYLMDLRSRKMSLASPTTTVAPCQQGNDEYFYSHVSLDALGRTCVYAADQTQSDGQFNASSDSAIFAYDAKSGSIRDVSGQVAASAQGRSTHAQSASEATLSANGASIAFSAGPTFHREAYTQSTLEDPALIYRAAIGNGAQAGQPISGVSGANADTFRSASLSADGHVLAFITSASLTPDDPGVATGPSHDAREDVYVQSS